MTEIWAVGSVLSVTADFFRQRGIESAQLDAELLLAHTLDLSRETLLARRERQLTDLEVSAYRERVRQRAGAKPVAYILNRKEFYSLPLYVDPHVLIPRPETEHLVEWGLAWMELFLNRTTAASVHVCDIGTGSGCVAAALSHSRPEAVVSATEIMPGASRIAAKNMSDLGLLHRVRVIHCDLFPNERQSPYDLIVSNPPYLSTEEYESLPNTIRRFEPREALTDGADGLGVYRKILARAPKYLKEGGGLMLEVSPRISELLPGIISGSGFRLVACHPDLAGRPRVMELRLN